jgi:hypothetical protein
MRRIVSEVENSFTTVLGVFHIVVVKLAILTLINVK